jgi:hypothetical protein
MSEYFDLKIITLYPICSYLFYLFCKKYYKYISVLDTFEQYDMYDNTDNYEKMEIKMVDKSTLTNYHDNYYNNILFAFNQIPT